MFQTGRTAAQSVKSAPPSSRASPEGSARCSGNAALETIFNVNVHGNDKFPLDAALEERISEIDQRIAELLALREKLNGIQSEAQNLPLDSQCDEQCVRYLLTVNR